jgi:hypothetical protein
MVQEQYPGTASLAGLTPGRPGPVKVTPGPVLGIGLAGQVLEKATPGGGPGCAQVPLFTPG